MVAADLAPDVPETLRDSFDRLRRLFAYGLFFYETFTAVQDLGCLVLEQAFRERFVTFYGGEIPLISKSGDAGTLHVTTFEEVYEALNRGGTHAKGGWSVRLRSSGEGLAGGAPLQGGLAQLQSWARQEGLQAGQMNKGMEAVLRRSRNWAAHPNRHIHMPSNAARVVRDLAEVINRLWDHCTLGGRLYPTPQARRPWVVGWADDQEATGHHVFTMAPIALAGPAAEGDDASSFMVVLAAAADVDNDKLYDFDARYERTLYPSEWLWGPGSRVDALAWLDAPATRATRSAFSTGCSRCKVSTGGLTGLGGPVLPWGWRRNAEAEPGIWSGRTTPTTRSTMSATAAA